MHSADLEQLATAALTPDALRALVQRAPEAIFVADAGGRYTYVNESGCKLLGCVPDDVIGKTIMDFIPAGDVPRLAEVRERLLSGTADVSEWSLRRKDGSWVPVDISANILPSGQWHGFVRDISARKAASAEREGLFRHIDEEKRWLRTVMDTLPVGVILFDRLGRISANARAQQLLRLEIDPEGGSAQYGNRILYPDGRPVPAAQLVSSRVMLHQETVLNEEYIIEQPGGARIPILGSAAPIRGEDGTVIGGVGVFQDMSERSRLEEQLRSTDQMFRTVFNLLPVGLWVADREGHITLGNAAGARIWQGIRHVGPEQFGEYKGWWVESGRAVTPDEWALTRAVRKGETSLSELIRIQCFDGTFKTVINWGAPIRDESGEITGAVAVNEDITALYKTQEQLRAAVREREEILAVVAHDLRNPLTGIRLAAEATARQLREAGQGRAAEASRTALDLIGESASQMSALVADLLAVAVSDGGRSMLELAPIKPLALIAQAARAARPLFARGQIKLDIDVDEDLPVIRVDVNRILRVIANLLDNALKFTTAGGSTFVGADEVSGGLRITVANTGPALSKRELEHMFQRFWQGQDGDRRGTGLGLSICRSIVEAHGGSIWAEPAEGMRVRVCVVLPRVQPEEDPPSGE